MKVKEQVACVTAVIATRWFDYVISITRLEVVSSLFFFSPTNFHSTKIKFYTLYKKTGSGMFGKQLKLVVEQPHIFNVIFFIFIFDV